MISGCSDGTPELKLHPVEGTISRGGQPVKGGGMILIPEVAPAPGVTVNASVSPQGTFTAETLVVDRNGRTIGKPGAPAGKYKATYHPPSDGSKSGLETELPDWITLEAKPNTLKIALPEKQPEGKGEVRDDLDPLPVAGGKKD